MNNFLYANEIPLQTDVAAPYDALSQPWQAGSDYVNILSDKSSLSTTKSPPKKEEPKKTDVPKADHTAAVQNQDVEHPIITMVSGMFKPVDVWFFQMQKNSWVLGFSLFLVMLMGFKLGEFHGKKEEKKEDIEARERVRRFSKD